MHSEDVAVVFRLRGEVHFTIWVLIQRILMQVFLVSLVMLDQAEPYYCLKERYCLTSVLTLVRAGLFLTLKVIICVLHLIKAAAGTL